MQKIRVSEASRRLIMAITMLAVLLVGGLPAMAEPEYNPALASKIAKMQSADAIVIKHAEGTFRFVGDVARIFLRTDYDLQTIYVPIAVAEVLEVKADTCLLKITAKTDQVTTANWVAFDRTVADERKKTYETRMTEARTLIGKGKGQKANVILSKLKDAGFRTVELDALSSGTDLEKVTTPDGRMFKDVIADPALRKRLAEADTYMYTLRMLQKKDWPDPSLLAYALELLPNLDRKQLEELEITMF